MQLHAHTAVRKLAQSLLLAQAVWVMLPALGADDLATRQRVDEALSLQRKGRDDLASDAWRKLLILDPDQRDALVNLGLIEARAGHTDEALALLARARRQSPRPRGIGQLEAALKGQEAALSPGKAATPIPDDTVNNPAPESRRERKARLKQRKQAQDVASKPTPASKEAVPATASAPMPTPVPAPVPAPPLAQTGNAPASVLSKSASLPPVRATAEASPPEPAPAPAIPGATLPKPRPTKALPFLPPPV